MQTQKWLEEEKEKVLKAHKKYGKTKALVTGGAGFIGSHLVEALVEKGLDVTVYDNFSSGSMKNLENVLDKITLHILDITNLDQIPRQSYDYVFHLAAKAWSEDSTETQETQTFQTNVIGTYNILKSNPASLFIFLSTANLYGNGRKFKENSPFKISSSYGYSKAIAERLIQLYNRPYIIFRPGTVIGSRGRCFPNLLVWSIVNKEKVKIFNNGNTLRDIIDVNDLVSALLISPKLPYGIYNLGSNSEISGLDLISSAKMIAKNHNLSLNFELTSFCPSTYVPHSTLLTQLEGSGLWKPKTFLKESLEKLFSYYLQPNIPKPPTWESL